MPSAPKSTSALPFLPGCTFDFDKKPEHFRKSHLLDRSNKVLFCHQDKPGIGGQNLSNLEPRAPVKTSYELYKSMGHVGEGKPSWIAFDRKVLRFYAYFQESVNERGEERYRVRKCEIFFYLEDDSIYVSEPRTVNSGIPQGSLICRHRILIPNDPNGQHYNLEHLNVDRQVTFYGKTFKIIGCDDFTRNFFQSINIEVPPNYHYPSDPYEVHRQELQSRMKASHQRDVSFTLKKFLEHDRHVLRFYCIWDDTLSLFGEAKSMVLRYFLADDTIEISDNTKSTSKDQNSKTFFRRGKVPKTKITDDGPISTEEEPITDSQRDVVECYTDRDLGIGAVLNVFGRHFILCDCDEYTQTYYREQYGINMDSAITFDNSQGQGELLRAMTLPPYNGWGSEEDSIGSCVSLIPKQPKKDFRRLMDYDTIVLRFEARLNSNKPVDSQRRFVLCYYVADESVQVFEPYQRNTGILGGKFLERTRLKKSNGTYYANRDFFIGAKIDCFGHVFILDKADEYALAYMMKHPEWFPTSNVETFKSKIKPNLPALKAALGGQEQSSLENLLTTLTGVVTNLSAQEQQTAVRMVGLENQKVQVAKWLAYLEQ